MSFQYPSFPAAVCVALVGCVAVPEKEPDTAPLDQAEIESRFPTLTVDCIPDARLDSWAWLNDRNLIIWTHAQRHNAFWLQMDRSCITMRNVVNMQFASRTRDLERNSDTLDPDRVIRQICGTGQDFVAAASGGFRLECPIGAVRPLNDFELNQVLVYFGKAPRPVRHEAPEEETAPNLDTDEVTDAE